MTDYLSKFVVAGAPEGNNSRGSGGSNAEKVGTTVWNPLAIHSPQQGQLEGPLFRELCQGMEAINLQTEHCKIAGGVGTGRIRGNTAWHS